MVARVLPLREETVVRTSVEKLPVDEHSYIRVAQ
jgi:hypothetical protein